MAVHNYSLAERVLFGCARDNTQDATMNDGDVLSAAADASAACLESCTANLGLTGAATRNFGTALRTNVLRQSLQGEQLRGTPLVKILGWIAAAETQSAI